MPSCPSCGEQNLVAARFCSGCGALLSVGTGREVRKTVTVVFMDVTGSTALGELLDPESLRRLMARYFDLARRCLESHGGMVEKFIGDAVMAVFGIPVVHEDDALRALRAASEVRVSLQSINVEFEQDYGISLLVRTGVNTGEVVTGTEERLATGDAVNVAARLEQAAEPGEILIGERTQRLTRDAIEVEPVEPLMLKGKAQPLAAFRLLRVNKDAPGFERRIDTPLVGRAEELRELLSEFDAAVINQQCRLVNVLGQPGIGKSRLARELAALLPAGTSVLFGSCLPYGEDIAYWPLRQMFRGAEADNELGAAIAAGAPEEVFWLVRKALERRARLNPLVLVIDDLHWAEPVMLDLIEHVVLWTRDAPLFLVSLARPELLDLRPAWGGRQLSLSPLSDADSNRLIETLLGREELEHRTRTRLKDVAAGNPLFVEQMLAMLKEGGDPGHVPPTIEAVISARLDSLPDAERELLERAAVIGTEFEWETLGALADDGRRPSGAALQGLVRKELIRLHESVDDAFRFRHALIRDAAYERIPKALRAELHERVAGLLERKGDASDESIGYHLERAYQCLTELGRPDDRSRRLAAAAAERLAASGQRAHDRGNTQASVNLLERATALYSGDDRRGLHLMPVLGRALREDGRLRQADTVLSQAVDRATASAEWGVAMDARVALVDLRFQLAPSTGVGRQDVLREIDAAILKFEELEDEAGLARALTVGGQLRLWGGEAASAVEDLERAARYADRAGDRAQLAQSIRWASTAMRRGPMPVEEALKLIEELRARALGNTKLEVVLLGARAHLEAMRCSFDSARALITTATALAEEYGLHALFVSHTCPAAGAVELLAGDPISAERLLRTACDETEKIGETGFLASIAPHLVDALLAQGRTEEAFLTTERWRADQLTVPEDADAQCGWRRVRAKALARRGELEDAEHLARQATAIASATDFLDLQANALSDLAEVLRIASRPDESATALEQALALLKTKGNAATTKNLRASAASLTVNPKGKT